MSSHFSRLCNAIGDLLFPLRCIGCGVYDTLACARCLAAHLQPHRAEGGTSTVRSVITLGLYADPFWRAVVAALKYHFQPRVLDEIGSVLAETVRQLLVQESNVADAPTYWCVPVPLHPRRERERGYNQSARIADALVQLLGGYSAPHLLRRITYTESQTLQGMTAGNDTAVRVTARQQNVVGTMALACVPDGVDWSTAHVLLVDDVVTTGATAGEAARVLRTLGVAHIDVIALARGAG